MIIRRGLREHRAPSTWAAKLQQSRVRWNVCPILDQCTGSTPPEPFDGRGSWRVLPGKWLRAVWLSRHTPPVPFGVPPRAQQQCRAPLCGQEDPWSANA